MKKIILLLVIIGALSSCSKDKSELEFVPGEVLVGIRSGTDIKNIFEFINQFDYKANYVKSLTFTSNLPSSKLQFVLDEINEKRYTNDGNHWPTTGHLHYKTKQITVFPRLFGMDNKAYQKDWLNTMTKLELNQKYTSKLTSGIIHFHVPIGQEIKSLTQFAKYSIVDWAQLNYIAEIDID